MKKFLILAALVLAIAAFVWFDAGQYLTLDALKARQGAIDSQYRAAPLLVADIFFLVYILLTSVSFPGATILTLAAGAIFGLVVGTVRASLASTIGATVAFLASRYLFGETVQRNAASPRQFQFGTAFKF